MQQLTITVKQLFDNIQDYLKIKLEKEVLTDISKINLNLKNEKNEWIKADKAIIKNKPTREIVFNNGITLKCANEHLVCLNPNESDKCVKAIDLKKDDKVFSIKHGELIVVENKSIMIVFDNYL
jgi:hypothetical protein